ncbi:MAG TPA: rhodanese-like domain-containing protein [Chloroflexota bacterium]|nr:rhodanese-like domain-containing protein [Chloroflexota bacterium]
MSWLFTRHRVTQVDPAEADRRRRNKTTIVVDVREAHELRDGSIPGSRHIPLGRLRAHVDELLAAPEVIFVCRSGNRSAAATAVLTKAGHPNAHNMVGGMIAWKRRGLPLAR